MTRTSRSGRAAVAAAWCTALAGGCALPDAGTGVPAPDAAPRTRAAGGDDPVQVFLSRGTVTDSDGDGYADTIPVIVYLFPDAAASELPVWADGEFEFRLMGPDQRLIARWVFPPEQAEQSRRRLPPGPAYSFFLRLGGDSDQIEDRTTLGLSAVFRPVEGRTVTSQGSAAVQLGGR